MPTIINNPPSDNRLVEERYVDGDRSGLGFMIGMILVIILGILLLVYGFPALRHGLGTTNNSVNVSVPSSGTSGSGTTGGTSGSGY